eukprot:scaffold1910_cov124-Skeletonema_dohrnii-CCMP3373.AAC.2
MAWSTRVNKPVMLKHSYVNALNNVQVFVIHSSTSKHEHALFPSSTCSSLFSWPIRKNGCKWENVATAT